MTAIDDDRMAKIALFAASHTYAQAVEKFGVSTSTVARAVARGREGEFGPGTRQALARKDGAPTPRKQAERKAKPAPARRTADLPTMAAMMIEQAEHYEDTAAKLRAAAAALQC